MSAWRGRRGLYIGDGASPTGGRGRRTAMAVDAALLWSLAGASGAVLLLSYALIAWFARGQAGKPDVQAVLWGRWTDRLPGRSLALWVAGTLVTAAMYLVLLVAATEGPTLVDVIIFSVFPLVACVWSCGVLTADAATANLGVVLTAAASMTLLLTVDGRRGHVSAAVQWIAAAWIVAHHVVIDAIWWAPSGASSGSGTRSSGLTKWLATRIEKLGLVLFGSTRTSARSPDETKLEIVAAWALFAVSWVPVAVSLARATRHSGTEPTATEPGTGEMPVTVVYYFAVIVLLFAAFGLVYMRYQYPASCFARSVAAAGRLGARVCGTTGSAKIGGGGDGDAWRKLHSIAGCIHYAAVFALFSWGTIEADYDRRKYLFPVRGFTFDDATWTYRCRTGNATCGDDDRQYSLKDRNERYPLLHLAAFYALWSGTVHLAAALDLYGVERRRWKWIDYFVSAPLMLSVVAVTFGHFGLYGVVLAPLVLCVALALAARGEAVGVGGGESPREKAYLGLSMVTKLTLHTFLLLTVVALGLSLDGSSADAMQRVGIGYGAAVGFVLLAGTLLAFTGPVLAAPGEGGDSTAAASAAAMAYAAFG